MKATCRRPVFRYIGLTWSRCRSCRRLAWDHEQADVLADIATQFRLGRELHLDPGSFPPAMRPLAKDGTILERVP